MTTLTFTSFADFGASVLAHQVRHVIRRMIHEIRPRPLPGGGILVGPVVESTFVAYANGSVLKCLSSEAETEIAVRWFENHDIVVKFVSDNIG